MFRVSCLQLRSDNDIINNLKKTEKLIKKAVRQKTDFILTPEISSLFSLQRKKLLSVVTSLKKNLKKAGINFLDHGSHIIPVIVGDAKLCTKASKLLLDNYDIYVQPINFPTVPVGTERLRLSASPLHSDEMISKLARALKEVFNELNIKMAA